MLYDVFISHASEDKEEFVRPLANALREQHVAVWYDEFSLGVGDSLRESIDKGLAQSRFAIVVLSPHFFAKRWPARELNGIVAREAAENRNIILPIWHKVERDEVIKASPPLADLVALSSTVGVPHLAKELSDKLRGKESPLVIARDLLLRMDFESPIISDGWWLDTVEFKESVLRFPETNSGYRWIFPLPHDRESREQERGENIAWSAMQRHWSYESDERGICQLTHPDDVHEFLRDCPGLIECARANAGVLALYAPQLTLHDFDNGFAEVFDALLSPSRADAYEVGRFGNPQLVEDDEPLCGELIAWRHPKFGNYSARELVWTFVHGHTSSYYRSEYNFLECLTWLLSDDSEWLPDQIRNALCEGMKQYDIGSGWGGDLMRYRGNSFSDAVWTKTRSKFSFSRSVRSGLVELFDSINKKMGLTTPPEKIVERFMAHDFVDRSFIEREGLVKLRSR